MSTATTPKANDYLMSRTEAAAALGVSLRTIERWSNKGWLTRKRLGARVMFDRVEIASLCRFGTPNVRR